MIIFLSPPDASVGRRSKPRSNLLLSGTGRLLSTHTGRTDGWFTAEPVDNRCRCKSPQTFEGGQPLVVVTLCKTCCKGGFVSPSALKRSLSTAVTQAAVAIARRQIRLRIGAATRLAEPRSATADYRARAWRPHRSMHGQERPQPVTKVRVNVARLPSALPSRDRSPV